MLSWLSDKTVEIEWHWLKIILILHSWIRSKNWFARWIIYRSSWRGRLVFCHKVACTHRSCMHAPFARYFQDQNVSDHKGTGNRVGPQYTIEIIDYFATNRQYHALNSQFQVKKHRIKEKAKCHQRIGIFYLAISGTSLIVVTNRIFYTS